MRAQEAEYARLKGEADPVMQAAVHKRCKLVLPPAPAKPETPATPLQAKVKRVSLKEVDLRLGGGYGIYKGEQLQWATLHFDAQAAVWVRAERWHPKQDARTLEDGTYELRVP